MSKTLKTRPLGVRIFDKRDHGVSAKEYHNHENGRECDLPEARWKHQEEHLENVESDRNEVCHWEFSYNGHNICGCRMCTSHHERKEENVKDRHKAKDELHRYNVDEIVEDDLI